MANPHKEVKELVKAAKKQGWRVKETRKGYMLCDPSGRHKETLHKTPSDPRGLCDSLSRMRRFGFKWRGKYWNFDSRHWFKGTARPTPST